MSADEETYSYMNPMDVFLPEEYRTWNLDIAAENLGTVFNGKSEHMKDGAIS